MKNATVLLLLSVLLSGCVMVPQDDLTKVNRCEISSDRKTLKVVNGFEDTNTFYSISGLVLLPISGVLSGTYVAVNNIYHLGEERFVCGPEKQQI
ncbi:hypothetical protein J2X32_002329 [Rheinheimera pacifica]|uniref:hypothetical protein n=1 Tax=Rheinheimera pacifica TaxID=173990 RepID=UPI000CBF3F27|nr:hypothetical protein [Rheinheimera pacifica]MDR6983693.1 hypothetical protein [Rheinheimera pacifica]PKM19935.1 MAG: hypothetical protein CVV11_09260 [Gammaproteobacteria bacterium HGW-Gammaproteobacteria-15]